MSHSVLSLGEDPRGALEQIREASRAAPVLVFKRSPICPVSAQAERELSRFLGELSTSLTLAAIDVIAERELARGLVAELGVRHESPQALWFEAGELVWHGSHGDLTAKRFDELIGEPRPD